MTTRTWSGVAGSFSDAGSWSPAGVPVSGDIAIINAGTVSLTSSPSGVTIQLNETSGESAATTLALVNATLDASATITTNDQNTYNANAPTISVSGTSAFLGTESFYGPKTTFTIAAGSTLVNSGTLNFYSSAPLMNGGGTFQNNNIVAIVNPAATSQYSIINDPVTGTGTIALGANARIELSGAVGATQTILLNDGASGKQTVQLDHVNTFSGVINGFSSSDLIAVVNTAITTSQTTYTATGSNSGVLRLFSGGAQVGSINFSGQYSLASFGFTFNDFGGGASNFQITTSVVNNQTGGLPSGYNNGGNGALPVYRFFDKVYGTHFFTSDIGERNTTLALSNYTEETNNFGDVTQSDPNSKPVYRFFDTKFGTHFFTANASERDNAINTRPDLTYEPNSTFYEHATQQPGDVAVYRLFDTQFGTHFYTGDQNEYNNITTAGSGAYRANLTPEGIEFYAPSGSFT